jgi:UDP-N-acetylmuramate--alanine ligase
MSQYNHIYFIGIGGIGMSAIARYYNTKGYKVSGYNRTCTPLTRSLESEGIEIHYEDNIDFVPKDVENTLVVYTPAVPKDMGELVYVQEHGYRVIKRSRTLGEITRGQRCMAVAGSHGKTTTSTLTSHIFMATGEGCSAFVGGISKNYATNCIISDSEFVVIEADEYDRSFHQLSPWMSVITSTDPDHLDIYGTKEAYIESFRKYTSLIRPGGALIMRKGLELVPDIQQGVRYFEYGIDSGDFHAKNIRIGNGEITFDLVSPIENVDNIKLGHPVPINIENGIAAMAMAQLNGCNAEELKYGMSTYKGVDRRFDFKVKKDNIVFLSDYAHHPIEVMQSAKSLKQLYQDKKITVIFQPHLYSRTNDFYMEFAESLSLFDEVILCEIYPAREEPIEGVTSKLIYDNLREGIDREMIKKDDVLKYVKSRNFEVLVVLGAGDLDAYVPQIAKILKDK